MVVHIDNADLNDSKNPPAQALRAAALPHEPDQDKHLTRSRTEILNILDGVRAQGEAVSVYIGLEENFRVSSILRADQDRGSIVFDHALDPYKNRPALLEKAILMFECGYQGARIRFQSIEASEAFSEGRPAFRIPIPEFVWWFQSHRPPQHAMDPGSLKIDLTLDGTQNAEAEVVDVTPNGLAVINCAADARLAAGQVLKNCAITLPGVGRIVFDLQVKYANPWPTGQGRPVKRIGCELVGLSSDLQQLIKHYVIGLRPTGTKA